MNVKEAIILFRYYRQFHHRKRTIDSYQTFLVVFEQTYGNRTLDSLQSDEMYQFLEHFILFILEDSARFQLIILSALLVDHEHLSQAQLTYTPA